MVQTCSPSISVQRVSADALSFATRRSSDLRSYEGGTSHRVRLAGSWGKVGRGLRMVQTCSPFVSVQRLSANALRDAKKRKKVTPTVWRYERSTDRRARFRGSW